MSSRGQSLWPTLSNWFLEASGGFYTVFPLTSFVWLYFRFQLCSLEVLTLAFTKLPFICSRLSENITGRLHWMQFMLEIKSFAAKKERRITLFWTQEPVSTQCQEQKCAASWTWSRHRYARCIIRKFINGVRRSGF